MNPYINIQVRVVCLHSDRQRDRLAGRWTARTAQRDKVDTETEVKAERQINKDSVVNWRAERQRQAD